MMTNEHEELPYIKFTKVKKGIINVELHPSLEEMLDENFLGMITGVLDDIIKECKERGKCK